MIKAVIFDLYETLVTQSETAVPRAGALGESLGLDATAYRREWKQLRPQVLCGRLTFQQALIEAAMRSLPVRSFHSPPAASNRTPGFI